MPAANNTGFVVAESQAMKLVLKGTGTPSPSVAVSASLTHFFYHGVIVWSGFLCPPVVQCVLKDNSEPNITRVFVTRQVPSQFIALLTVYSYQSRSGSSQSLVKLKL